MPRDAAHHAVHVHRDLSDRRLRTLLKDARSVAIDEPLSRGHRAIIAAHLEGHPDLAVRVFGHYGTTMDADLRFLDGLEATRHLDLDLAGLRGLAGLVRFEDLRTLAIGRSKKSHSLAGLPHPEKLETVRLGGPMAGLDVLRSARNLTTLHAPSTEPLMAAIGGLPALSRLTLQQGTHRDLTVLATLPALADLELWTIRHLDHDDLACLAAAPRLRALALGPARNVRHLRWIAPLHATLRYLALEGLPALDTLHPLTDLHELRAFGCWDTRTADRSLRALHDLPLDDVLPAQFPKTEIDDLHRALPHARIGVEASHFRWRGLFAYVDCMESTREP